MKQNAWAMLGPMAKKKVQPMTHPGACLHPPCYEQRQPSSAGLSYCPVGRSWGKTWSNPTVLHQSAWETQTIHGGHGDNLWNHGCCCFAVRGWKMLWRSISDFILSQFQCPKNHHTVIKRLICLDLGIATNVWNNKTKNDESILRDSVYICSKKYN